MLYLKYLDIIIHLCHLTYFLNSDIQHVYFVFFFSFFIEFILYNLGSHFLDYFPFILLLKNDLCFFNEESKWYTEL